MAKFSIAACFILFVPVFACEYDQTPLGLKTDLQYNGKSWNSLAQAIQNQDEIYEMDDCSRSYKYVNGVTVRLGRQPSEDDSDGSPTDCCPQYLGTVLDSLKIAPSLFAQLRKQLYDTELQSFYKTHDTVLFIADGFLSHDWGYLFCSRKLSNDTDEFKIVRYDVWYTDAINANWKKVGVH